MKNMRTKLVTILLISLTLFGPALHGRTAVDAKGCASQFLSQRRGAKAAPAASPSLSLAHESRSAGGDVDYYVFNVADDGGFVIVCGEDRVPPIMGYCDKGLFAEDSLPDNMRWWLTEYQRQLQYLRDHPSARPRQEIKLSTSVPALMSTKWNQSKGYNSLCPAIPTGTHPFYDGKACTGCVATAMAQIMKYHRWPSSGIGHHNYVCDVQYGTNDAQQSYTATLSADFSKSTYNWDNMVNAFKYYTQDYVVFVEETNTPATAQQINAVSKLMSDVGISLDMNYGSYERGGSAAYTNNVETALKTYFGYDNSALYIDRDYYSGDFELVLRTDLDAHRPVLFSGSTANHGGHAFVLDGYDANGYYHVNWGWGGTSDGYYLLSLLSPEEQGAGSSEGGYNYRQLAVTNIQPTESGKVALVTDITPITNPMPNGMIRATAEVQAAWGAYTGDIELFVLDQWGITGDYCKRSVSLADGEKKTIQFECPFNGQENQTYYLALKNPFFANATDMYGEFRAWGAYVPFTVTKPAVLTSPTNESTIDFGNVNANETCQKSIYVKGERLTGQLNIAINGDAYFTTTSTTLDSASVNNGTNVNVTYAPLYAGTHTAQLTIEGGGLAEPVTVNLQGTATGNVAPAVVDSMLTSYWNQNVPYKNACPVDANGVLTPPGCGAVAMGQILNYHRVTNHGFGHAVYDNLLANGTVDGMIDVNFDERTYDWSNILDDYSAGYTDEQANAVADFLVQVGAGMKMMYRATGSTPANDGSMLWGLHHHLHISSKCMKHYRRDYTTQQWREMLNRELQNGRPVLYGGGWTSPINGSVVGHIFVIDGVNAKGEYHVNFGQTRNKNLTAYLSLEELNQSGTHPGGRGVCWQLNSYMLTDLLPVADDDYVNNNLISIVVPTINGDAVNRETVVNLNDSFKLGYTLANYQYDQAKMEFGIGFYQNEVLQGLSFGANSPTSGNNSPGTVQLGGGSRFSFERYYRIPSGLTEGEYEVKFICRPQGSSNPWLPVFEIAPSTMTAQVNGDQAHIIMPENHQLATHLRLAEPVQVVETEYANIMPGTTLQHKFINPSDNNFQDTIRVDVMVDGVKIYSHKYLASVYEQCQTTYNILIPDALCDLKDKQFTTESYYYEKMLARYVKLEVGDKQKTADINGDGGIDIADVNITINAMLGHDSLHRSSADLDKNGMVDIADVNIAINAMLAK